MKLQIVKMLAVAALFGGLTACNNELGEPQADQVPENAVRITASINNPFATTRSMPLGTVEDQAKFKEGDEILVKTDYSEQRATYRFDGTAWKPKDGKYLLWKYDWAESFRAYYTVESGLQAVAGEPYVFPTDQSSIDKIAKADLMQAVLDPAKTKEVLHFAMQRSTARLIVKIAGFNSEFPADAKVKNVEFHSKSNASAPQVTYTPYADGEGKAGSTYTVLVPSDAANHTVSLTVGSKAMTAKLQDYSYDVGKSYTYRLTVGKEKLEVGEVTVADWSGSAVITGGEANLSKWDGVTTSAVTPEADGKTYNIKDAEEWVWLCEQVGNNTIPTNGLIVNLIADLNFGGHEMYPLGYTKDNASGKAVEFWGTLNGNHHTIKELKMTKGTYRHLGLIAQLDPNSTVKDLTVECDIKGNCDDNTSEAVTIGGIAGNCMGGTMQNCTVKGTVSSDKIAVYMGGVVGYFYGGTMMQCSNYANVVSLSDDSRIIGGVAGCVADLLLSWYNMPSFMIACVNYGTISVRGDGRAGGITGEAEENQDKPNDVRNTFVACYNVGDIKVVEGKTYVGEQASGLCTATSEKSTALYGCFSAGTLPQNGKPGVSVCKPYGNGVFALSDASDDLPKSVGIADTGKNCGKKTRADLNSPATIKAMNDAIEAFNAKEPTHTCTYRFKAGPTYPVLK